MIRFRAFIAALCLTLWAFPALALTTSLTAEATFLLVSTNGTHTATLYDPSKIPGHVVTIKNDTTQAGTTTIATAAGDIDGSATVALTGAGAFVTVRAAGGKWKITSSSVSVGGGVPSSRSIATTSPLTGGGDLSTNRTFAINAGGTANRVALTTDGSAVSFGQVNLATSQITGTLPNANQGAQTLSGDVGGTTAASVVNTLTGTAGAVAVPSGNLLNWSSSGPTFGARPGTPADLFLKVNTANSNFVLNDGSNILGFYNYNSGSPYFQQFNGTGFQLISTNGDLVLQSSTAATLLTFKAGGSAVAGTWGAATLTLNTPFLTFGAAATNPTISQTDPTNQIGGVAGWYAQNGNGTNKTGGLIQLWGGKPTGSADSGYVTIGTQNAAGTTFPMVQAMTISGQHVVAIGKETVLTTSDYSSTVGDRTLYLADATGIGTGVMPANGTVVYSFAGSPTWKGSNGGKTVSWTSNTSDTATGGLDVLPAAPAKFLSVTVDGTTYKIPLYSP